MSEEGRPKRKRKAVEHFRIEAQGFRRRRRNPKKISKGLKSDQRDVSVHAAAGIANAEVVSMLL